MSITFCKKYTAEGPYTSTESLEDRSGVYIILTRAKSTDKWTVIDVGESHELKTRVENHDRGRLLETAQQGDNRVCPLLHP